MKIKIISIIICFIFPPILNAQNIKNNPVKFGVRAGVNFSHINFSRGEVSAGSPGETNFFPGATAGFLMIVPIYNSIYIQPEYSYTGAGGEIKNSGIKLNFHYLTLPVLLRWELTKNFAILGGPQFELLINASEKTDGNSQDIIHQTEERSIGFAIGTEYQIYKSVGVGLRYIHGFNNIGINRNSGEQEFKFENFQLVIFYLF